ncbi:MAG: hypothetical protein KAU29_00750 [Gammaproteobacteria bacterium]|nr:hypothetical protein [Gammaproteobacteria bacterium]
MSEFNFADSYKAAGLSPGPEIISLRQEPFDKLLKTIDKQMVFNLSRLYFGLTVPDGTEWFREAFGETDSSFSMLDNEREAAVLSACLLNAAISNNNVIAALAVLTTSAGGNRIPIVLPQLIEDARAALINIAVDNRKYQTNPLKQIKLPAKNDIEEAVDALVAAPAWPPAGDLFKQVNGNNFKTVKNLANQMNEVLSPLANQLADVQEEVAMLWWHIGGWSRVLDKPFAGLEPGLMAVMVGLDLADLSRTLAGPAAAPAILHKTIFASHDLSTEKVSIKNAVDAFPTEVLAKLELDEELKNLSDICPVLTGFLKAHENGESPAWESAFEKLAFFDPTTTFELLEIAMQVYRERSLLSASD